jgi:hypothetical protein
MLPVGVALAALARRDLLLAAWLAPMALGPAAGWYAGIVLMLTRSPGTAAVGSVPIPGAMAAAAVIEALSSWSPRWGRDLLRLNQPARVPSPSTPA